jgi:hypothetical protein
MSENSHQTSELIYDPRGVVDVQHTELAARVAELDGLRLGVLSNTKWNAAKLLRATVRVLESRGLAFAGVRHYDKEHFSKDAAPELIAQISAESDIALTAIGDCGSCTSCCVNDAVRLEQAGVPTAVIVTTEFEHEARLQREARGMAALRPIVVTHPISSLTLQQLDQRAGEAAPQAEAIWTGTELSQEPTEALGRPTLSASTTSTRHIAGGSVS